MKRKPRKSPKPETPATHKTSFRMPYDVYQRALIYCARRPRPTDLATFIIEAMREKLARKRD